MRRLGFFAPLFVCALALLSALTPTPTRAQKLAAGGPVSFTALEQEVVAEINLARTRPAEYAAFLEQLRPLFKGNEYRQPGRPALVTQEGLGALDEAIRALRAAKPAGALSVSKGMCSGAKELVTDHGATGGTGHRGADGSFCEQRVQRFGMWTPPIGENLSFGPDSARERVLALLIDDGFASRGHRKRLLDPAFKVVGVACGNHKEGPLCVITLAGGFADKAQTSAPASKQSNTPAGAKRF